MSNQKTQDMYKRAHQLITQAKDFLLANDEINDTQQAEINAWLQQADEIEKKAKQLDAVLDRDAELAALAAKETQEKESKELEKREKEAGFKKGHEYMVALYDHYMQGKTDPRLQSFMVTKDMAGEVGVSGGFLLQQAQQQQIITARAEESFVRARARVIPMGARVIPFPTADLTGGAAGVSAFFSGIRMYWVAENAAITESQPTFKEAELHARELAGYAEIPNGLIRDSAVSLEAWLSGPFSFGGALGWQEDYEALRGNGVGKPEGVLNASCAAAVTRNTASHFYFADVVGMAAKMVMSGGGSPVWVLNQSLMPELYSMVDAGSNLVWLPNAAGGGPQTLLGWPIIWTEKLPVLGTAGDAMLCNFAWYLLGDRGAMTMDIDRSYKFQNNQTAFRVVEAIDGKPWLTGAITLADGTTTVSPFVYLN